MADLIDYVLWRGDVSLKYSPFNKVDALVFSQLSYLNWKGIIPDSFSESVELKVLAELLQDKKVEKKLIKNLGPYINPDTFKLLKLTALSERFKNLTLSGFRDIYSKRYCEQFAAFTVSGIGFNCVCYRGTDETVIGWKEDFELSYMDVIPSQTDALKYLEDSMKSLKGKFYISGHSKGGNNAMYAAINCSDSNKKRISAVYNFDGPGFHRDILESSDYKKVEKKIHSVYPECSIVGMFFEHTDQYEIAESNRHIVMQHDPFSWGITANGFVNKNQFEDESVFFYKTFNQWYAELSRDQLKNITDKMFGIILNTGVETLSDMEKDRLHNSAEILKELLKVDSKDRREVLKIANMFLKAGKGNFPLFDSFKPSFGSLAEKVFEKRDI